MKLSLKYSFTYGKYSIVDYVHNTTVFVGQKYFKPVKALPPSYIMKKIVFLCDSQS